MKTETELRDELLKAARVLNEDMMGCSPITKMVDFALPYAQRAEAAEAKVNEVDYCSQLLIGKRFRYRYVDWSKDTWSIWQTFKPQDARLLIDASVESIQFNP